ncbi:hypothetical protein Sta7437_2461 [Stanieria cyanosphaera PCC 7437]|uniref:Uncharacterized protein n=1 Tax=Stanieria cyanosphaera (strain ATCC 29371 / PCC 7437) TaxID=111780 RepID=K9XTR8_STAC7|nr:hypothetical protein Sta7437_2461 [Stanieria cyanosphaera PCC 7437]
MTSFGHRIKDYGAGFPRLTTRFSWLFPFLVFHHLPRYETTSYFISPADRLPRQFPFPTVHGYSVSLCILPVGKHFTQPPSLQSRLFLGCNPLCLIFKVLPVLGFCFSVFGYWQPIHTLATYYRTARTTGR